MNTCTQRLAYRVRIKQKVTKKVEVEDAVRSAKYKLKLSELSTKVVYVAQQLVGNRAQKNVVMNSKP